MIDKVAKLQVTLYITSVKFSGRGGWTVLIIESNNFVKGSDVHPVQTGMATINIKVSRSGMGIDEACGQEEKKMKGYFWIEGLQQYFWNQQCVCRQYVCHDV